MAAKGGNRNLLVLPGDGIGPEVVGEAQRLIEWLDRRGMARFEIAEGPIGGASIDRAPVAPGADAEEILAEAGYDSGEIETFRAEGVI